MQPNQDKKTQILAHIEKLALQLFQDKNSYTRADIAYDLKSAGIDGDSSLIDDFIHELFNSTSKPEIKEAITHVFFNNNFTRAIIDNATIKQFIQTGQLSNATALLAEQEKHVNEILVGFSNEMSTLIHNAGVFIKNKNVVATVTGTYRIDNVRNEAESLFQNYSKIISGYTDAKQRILNLIEDYSIIRTEIVKRYKENVTRLTDVFGSNIKAVEPAIFDFDTIAYLQVDKMLENIELQFNTLIQSCEDVIAVINETVINDLSQSSKLVGKSKDSRIALALAGVSIVKSHLNATKQTAKLNQGVALMRQKMDYDTSSIQADLLRLQLIDKTLNEVSIPAAFVFQRKFDNLFDQELEGIFQSFYKSPVLKDLKAQKDILLVDSTTLNNQIVDHKNQVVSYENRLSSNKTLLEQYRELYQESVACKPKKPNAAQRLVSFGSKQKSYYRDINEWHTIYEPVIKAYFDINEDIKIDQEELQHHTQAIQLKEIQLRKVSRELEQNSAAIFNTISEDAHVQEELSKHLVPIINLLRIGRKVAEFKIDSEYLEPVNLEELNISILPDSTMERLQEFTQSLKSNINIAFKENTTFEETEPQKNNDNLLHENIAFKKNDAVTMGVNTMLKEINHEIEEISDQQILFIEKQILDTALLAVDIVEETAKLKKLEFENTLARNLYESKLDALREQFKIKIDAVNDRSQVLAQVISSINTNQQPLQVDALKELIEAEDDFWITENEIIAAFKTGKSINI